MTTPVRLRCRVAWAGALVGAVSLASCTPGPATPSNRATGPAIAPERAPGRTAAETLAKLEHEAHAARDAGDFSTYRAKLLALLDLLHGHRDVAYALAGAEARLGHPDEALRWLEWYADAGIARADVGDDPQLATLRGDPRFARMAARIAANDHAISNATLAYTLPDEELLAEDIAYDRAAGLFYVSAVRSRKIVAIAVDGGAAHDFVRAGADGLLSVMALGLDATHDRLLATASGLPHGDALREQDKGKTALFAFDRRTAALAFQAPFDGGPGEHSLSDMTIAPGGDAFVSDSAGGRVYRFRAETHAFEHVGEPAEFIPRRRRRSHRKGDSSSCRTTREASR